MYKIAVTFDGRFIRILDSFKVTVTEISMMMAGIKPEKKAK